MPEDRRSTSTPATFTSILLSLSHSVPISFSLAPHSPSFSLSIFLSSCPPSSPQCIYPTKASGSVCTVMPRGRNFQCVSPSVIQVCVSRPRFSVQRYTSVRRARLCTRCSRYFAVIRGEEERERRSEAARPRALIASPVTQYVVYSSNFLFVAFHSRTC